MNYFWIILLIIYIISPIDANPLFIDDLIASVALFYFLYKNARDKKQQPYQDYYRQSQTSHQSEQNTASGSQGTLTLDEAYRLLGVSPNASLDETSRAYREKMTKSHPDKVSHLSEELQEKAKELTLKISEAYEVIKRHKGK